MRTWCESSNTRTSLLSRRSTPAAAALMALSRIATWPGTTSSTAGRLAPDRTTACTGHTTQHWLITAINGLSAPAVYRRTHLGHELQSGNLGWREMSKDLDVDFVGQLQLACQLALVLSWSHGTPPNERRPYGNQQIRKEGGRVSPYRESVVHRVAAGWPEGTSPRTLGHRPGQWRRSTSHTP